MVATVDDSAGTARAGASREVVVAVAVLAAAVVVFFVLVVLHRHSWIIAAKFQYHDQDVVNF